MELAEAIKGRRSVRKFKTQPVSRETLEKLPGSGDVGPFGDEPAGVVFCGRAGIRKKMTC